MIEQRVAPIDTQRAPRPGFAMTLKAIVSREATRGLGIEMRDAERLRRALSMGSANALPVTEAVDRLSAVSLHYTSGLVEQLGELAYRCNPSLGYVALYDLSTSRFERPMRSALGVPALRTRVDLMGTTTYRTGGLAYGIRHRFGRTEPDTRGDVFMSNDTDLAHLPLISFEATPDAVTLPIDFLQAPTPVMRPVDRLSLEAQFTAGLGLR